MSQNSHDPTHGAALAVMPVPGLRYLLRNGLVLLLLWTLVIAFLGNKEASLPARNLQRVML